MWKIIIMVLYLLVLSIYDCKEKRVPVWLLYIGGMFVTIVSVIDVMRGVTIWLPLLGTLPGILLIFVAFVTGKMGIADGIVLTIAGVLLGPQESWIIFVISLMLIFVSSVFLLLMRKIKLRTRIPYIPFLTVAFVLLQTM